MTSLIFKMAALLDTCQGRRANVEFLGVVGGNPMNYVTDFRKLIRAKL